eukprot:Phypoly_transcript_16559.p2 GENE.Phypoly_transcript_16559~~Phypoly_transcript_16559.p2  ORF type:complete len:168 (+),score=24.42 Phypoly_transcript_16559:178-681(+)
MPRTHGLRRQTRHKFSQAFRQHGHPNLSTYLVNYHLGDMVDIKANSSVHRGMPHRLYHGKTGKVWNITPRAVGVEVLKRVRGKYLRKRIHVRIEHVKLSHCRDELNKRIALQKAQRQRNAQLKKEGKPTLPIVGVKRSPVEPLPAHTIKIADAKIERVAPVKYELLM